MCYVTRCISNKVQFATLPSEVAIYHNVNEQWIKNKKQFDWCKLISTNAQYTFHMSLYDLCKSKFPREELTIGSLPESEP